MLLLLWSATRTQGVGVGEEMRLLRRGGFSLEDGNATEAPTSNSTAAPTNATTMAPTNATTSAPTMTPKNATTEAPTAAPKTSTPTAAPFTAVPTTSQPVTTPPTTAPTAAPSGTKAPTGGDEHKGISFWRFVEKTIAYMILLVLALLGFGGTFLFELVYL